MRVTANTPGFNSRTPPFSGTYTSATLLRGEASNATQRQAEHSAITIPSIDQRARYEWTCRTATNIQEATALIEAGFEYVTEIDGTKLFKKRK